MNSRINGFVRDYERSARQMPVENSAKPSRMSAPALSQPLRPWNGPLVPIQAAAVPPSVISPRPSPLENHR